MGKNRVQKLIHTNVVSWSLAKVQKRNNREGIVFLTSTADSIYIKFWKLQTNLECPKRKQSLSYN